MLCSYGLHLAHTHWMRHRLLELCKACVAIRCLRSVCKACDAIRNGKLEVLQECVADLSVGPFAFGKKESVLRRFQGMKLLCNVCFFCPTETFCLAPTTPLLSCGQTTSVRIHFLGIQTQSGKTPAIRSHGLTCIGCACRKEYTSLQ